MEKKGKKRKDFKKFEIEEKNGLKISYKKDEFDKQFPHLIKEISLEKKAIRIDSVNTDIDQNHKEEIQEHIDLSPDELSNPGAIDFIRRCTKEEEAINILDYMLKRNELSQEDYYTYKNIISQEGGLKKLIDESGGPKQPGYYLDKYYFKLDKNQKLNSKED
ncbi:MAG: DUF2095 family protein [Candidatus Hodarchaeota archaeon]